MNPPQIPRVKREGEAARPTDPVTIEHVYGINPAFEVLRARRREVYRAWLSESGRKHPRLKKLETILQKANARIRWEEKGRLTDRIHHDEHQGVVLEVSPYPYVDVDLILGLERVLLLDNIEDPHNVGAIMRSAEALGFAGICLPVKGTPEVYASVVKASAGACEHLSVCRETSSIGYVKKAREAGFTIFALDRRGGEELSTITLESDTRLMLVAGGEDRSVGQFILNEADKVISLDQTGRVNSLNTSVATGIAMYALRNRPENGTDVIEAAGA